MYGILSNCEIEGVIGAIGADQSQFKNIVLFSMQNNDILISFIHISYILFF